MRPTVLLLLGILITACAFTPPPGGSARSNDPRAVLNVTWQWVATVTPVDKVEVPAPERYTLFLAPEGKARMMFDCNRGGGDYKMTQGKITFGPLISTRMACPPDTLGGRFMHDLQRVVSYFIDSGRLFLELPDDSGTMTFRPAP